MAARKRRLLTPPLLIFMATMILANIASRMHRPLMPLYLQELGASVGNVGLFFTLGAFAPLAFQIFGGWLSDQVGRLQAIALGSPAVPFYVPLAAMLLLPIMWAKLKLPANSAQAASEAHTAAAD